MRPQQVAFVVMLYVAAAAVCVKAVDEMWRARAAMVECKVEMVARLDSIEAQVGPYLAVYNEVLKPRISVVGD